MIEFLDIASSSSGCCYILTSDVAGRLLVDPGVSLADIQAATGHSLSSLSGCLVSHAHQDHCRSAAALAARRVPVYAHAETLTRLSDKGQPDGWRRSTHALDHGRLAQIGEWAVEPFLVPHDCPGTLGFYVTDGHDRLIYITDALCSPVVAAPTIVAIEANHDPETINERKRLGEVDSARWKRTRSTHMSIDQCIATLQAFDLSRCREIVLLHLSDSHSDEEDFLRHVRRATGIPTRVAAKTRK